MSLSALPAAAEAASPDFVPTSVAHDAIATSSIGTRGVCALTLPLRHAGSRRVQVAWECIGPADAPLLVVQGGISATRHVAASPQFRECGWWEAQVGGGRALDPQRCRVFAIDWLGADGALDAAIDPSDQADAIAAVLDALGLGRVAVFVGASYGAMVGLQFAARHGGRLDRLVAISGAHRSHPQATALRVIQRRIVRLGRNQAAVREALALARSLAVIGYRTADEFDARFDAEPSFDDGRARFAVEDYFDAVGPRFVARFTPTAYLRLSESIDLQRVDPAAVRVPTELVAIEQDQIVPLRDLYALAEGIGARCRLHRIASRFGHDAFLKEGAAIDAILRRAIDAEVGA
jgi:homoserine O-acetyltransferase/O-succinyltransferase